MSSPPHPGDRSPMLNAKRRGNTAKVSAYDPVWDQIRAEAEDVTHREPELTAFIFANILNHSQLEHSVCHRLAQRLGHDDVDADLIRQTFLRVRRKPSRVWDDVPRGSGGRLRPRSGLQPAD